MEKHSLSGRRFSQLLNELKSLADRFDHFQRHEEASRTRALAGRLELLEDIDDRHISERAIEE